MTTLEWLDLSTFLAGVVAGVGLTISVALCLQFLFRHWRALLVLAALCGGVGLLLLGI